MTQMDGITVLRYRCRRHPNKFICPSVQATGRHTGCATCRTHRLDGSLSPARKRQDIRSSYKGHYKQALRNHAAGIGRLSPVQLFERSIGGPIPMFQNIGRYTQ